MAAENLSAGAAPCFLGAGAYRHHAPAAVDALIQRGEFLTSYTPYQPEISQGTLQALFEFQTQVAAITGMEVANASMYDGATACAEAVLMAGRATRRRKAVLSGGLHPHYAETVETLARFGPMSAVHNRPQAPTRAPHGTAALEAAIDADTACVVVQQPDLFGAIRDFSGLAQACRDNGALLVAVVCEPVSLGALAPPGAWGADIVAGEGQGLGVGLSFGGPHVGLFAAREKYVRQMPGRLAGQTADADGRRGWVLTLNAREQHIRRGKATSNICTNSRAVRAGVLDPPRAARRQRLPAASPRSTTRARRARGRPSCRRAGGRTAQRRLLQRIHAAAAARRGGGRRGTGGAARARRRSGLAPAAGARRPGAPAARRRDRTRDRRRCRSARRRPDGDAGMNRPNTLDTVTGNRALDIEEPLIFEQGGGVCGVDLPEPPPCAARLGGQERRGPTGLPDLSEPQVVRHYTRLSRNNFAIDTGTYPLGSCTMKHNPRLNEKMARLPGFADLHPLQPVSTAQGALRLMDALARWLKTLTGMPAVALPPAAGAQGELCGMMTIRACLEARGDARQTVLAPESAHGTNPATAVACGYRVEEIAADATGRVDRAALEARLGPDIAAIMITNPNTCGLFERDIAGIAEAVHAAGALVYCDGANFNAIAGRVRPARPRHRRDPPEPA